MIFLIQLFAILSYSQEVDTNTSRHSIALQAGTILPNNIEGVSEIQSAWGFRYSFPYAQGKYYELGYNHSNSNGVELSNPFISIKNEASMEGFIVQLFLGADATIYKTDTGIKSTKFGGHFGSALLIEINRSLLFRSDMKFTVKPGQSLYIGFGLERKL